MAKVRPLHDRVLVKRIEEKETTRAESSSPTPRRRSRWRARSSRSAPARSWRTARSCALEVKVGDRILFGKYSGTEIKIDGEEHVILREDEVLAVIG